MTKLLYQKFGAKVMIAVNMDIHNRLMNDQIGEIQNFQCLNDRTNIIHLKSLDPKKWLINIQYKLHLYLEKSLKQTSQFLKEPLDHKRYQFPLVLSWACTIHKLQDLSLNGGVVDFGLQKQKSFNTGQIYTALGRVRNYQKLFCMGKYNLSAVELSRDALDKYGWLRQNSIFETIQEISKTVTILLFNVKII